MKIALVLLGISALYLVQATSDPEVELEASELQELQDEFQSALDLVGESLETEDADKLEEARIKWGKLFKTVSKAVKKGKKYYAKGKKLYKNKNVQKALKFGKQLAANMQGPEEGGEGGEPVGNNKCLPKGTTCTDDCDCCPEDHCHCPGRKWLPGLFRCSCQTTESDKVNKCGQ